MEKKFKKGDYVRRVLDGAILRIDVIKDDWIAYRDNRVVTGACPMEEVEPIDSKTAFLSELKELLSKYDAKISIGLDGDAAIIGIAMQIGGEKIYYPFTVAPSEDKTQMFDLSKSKLHVTADNIMDYEKE